MEVRILEEKENVFFKRKDVKLELIHHGSATPSKREVERIVAEKFKTTPDHVLVDYIFGKTGIGESVVKAKIYKEKVKKPEKEKEKPEEKTEEVKEEPKPEEKPTEGAKQEKKEGEKVETQTG